MKTSSSKSQSSASMMKTTQTLAMSKVGTSKSLTKTIPYSDRIVVPVVKAERHPLYHLYEDRLSKENRLSNERTRSRLLMKRFVFDVQELWLANLEHLREHRSDQLYSANENEAEQAENYQRGRGLDNRRDVKEITSMNHQIQAVSQKRAFSNAFHTTRLPTVNIALDYVPFRTPTLSTFIPSSPQLVSIANHLRIEPRDNISLQHGFQFFDGTVCQTPFSFTLNIDRLIPSADFIALCDVSEVLWRLELIHSASLTSRTFICKEKEVVSALSIKPSTNMEFSSYELCVLEGPWDSYISSLDNLSQWRIQRVQVVQYESLHSETGFVPFYFAFNVELCNARGDLIDPLQVQMTPFEVAYVAHLEQFATVPRFDSSFYHCTNLHSLWVSICKYLKVRCIRNVPQSLHLVDQNSKLYTADALSDLQAQSSAYEVLQMLSLARAMSDSAHIDIKLLEVIDVTDKRNELQMHLKSFSREAFLYDIRSAATKAAMYGCWEQLFKYAVNASFQASGCVAVSEKVPGSCEFGKKGFGFSEDHIDALDDSTQAAAKFFRDSMRSSTDSIMVNSVLALATRKLFDPVLAVELFSLTPTPYPAEESIPQSTLAAQFGWNIQLQPLRSPLEKRVCNTVVAFGSFPVEGIDYLPKDVLHRPVGFKRFVPIRNQFGFREQTECPLLELDAHVDSHVYGITRHGAIPNNLSVNSRNIWHNVIAVSEHINRPRNSKDYHYIIAQKNHCGTNVANSYTTRMRGDEMVGLTSSILKQFEDTYEKIKQLRDVFNKQLALDMKIEKVENELKVRESMQRRTIQDQLQRQLEKKLNKATKSERGWRRRYKCSKILEIQGNWERREDDRSGLIFFHQIIPNTLNEKYLTTCQWEVPTEWDGDIWNNTNLDMQMLRESHAYNKQDAQSTIASQNDPALVSNEQLAAFAEPDNVWLPKSEHGQATLRAGVKANKNFRQQLNERNADDVNSTMAEESYAPSSVDSIQSETIEKIAEQLLQSDDVIRILARRLGIADNQIIPVEDLQSVFSVDSSVQDRRKRAADSQDNALNAPRDGDYDDLHEIEVDSEDDTWSDDEIAVGDFDHTKMLAGDSGLPQNQFQAAELRRRETQDNVGNKFADQFVAHGAVPYLDFSDVAGIANAKIEQNQERYGWRRLPRPSIGTSFLSNALKTHTRGPDPKSCNTINAPVFLIPISPVDACKYVPEEFSIAVESLFVPDVKKDMERAVATLDRNIRIEEELARNMPSDDLFLFGEAKEFTSVDAFLAKQFKEDQAAVSDPKEAAKEKAILAAKATNIAQMEDALAEDIPINTADEFGNSLLILAAQQGSKRMCKFLLRRGANINLQNLTGNTALHYCYAYGNRSLGDYLKAKGANDSVVNVDGLTCYEGLNRENMNQTYADYTEEDYENSMET